MKNKFAKKLFATILFTFAILGVIRKAFLAWCDKSFPVNKRSKFD